MPNYNLSLIRLNYRYQIINIDLTKKFGAIFEEYQSPKSAKGDMQIGLKDLL